MKITSLGHGGAFATYEQGNSSFLIENDRSRFLFDCGPLTPLVLRDKMDIPLDKIDSIYISHYHADHVGGLPMVLHTNFWFHKKKTTLYVADEVWAELEPFLRNELKGFSDKPVELEDYIERAHVTTRFSVDGVIYYLKPSKHIRYEWNGWKPCYGLEFILNPATTIAKLCLITADTTEIYANGYDYVIQDCGMTRNNAHAFIEDIIIKCNDNSYSNIYLTHYGEKGKHVLPGHMQFFARGDVIKL